MHFNIILQSTPRLGSNLVFCVLSLTFHKPLQSLSPITSLAPSPHVVHVRLALLLHTREGPGSNLGADTDYPKVLRGFNQSLEAEIQ
jgi:hypothetical protein